MASLQKRSNGRYYIYFYDKNRDPKRKSVPTGTTRKRAARRIFRRLEDEYATGDFDPWTEEGKPLPISDAIDKFLKSKSNLQPTSQEAYREILENWPLPPTLMIQDIQPDHMRPYVCDRDNVVRTDERTFKGRRKERVSVATLRKRYRHLRTFFNWSVKQGLIDSSPLEEINPPREEKSVPDFLTPDQLESLLRTIDADHEQKKAAAGITPQVQWLKDTILLAVCTGMRRGELANLQWGHVDLDSGFITVRNNEDFRTKSGNERRIPIAGDATEVLTRLQSEYDNSRRDYVLTNEDGSRISPDYASERFKYYIREAGLPDHLKFHSLRDTCASWLVQNGVPLAVVQKVLGHSNQSTTEKYAHLTPEVMQRAMQDTFDD